MTLQQLASATSVSHAHLSRIERDEKRPSPELLVRIVHAMDGDPRPLLAASVGLEAATDPLRPANAAPATKIANDLRAVAAVLHPEL